MLRPLAPLLLTAAAALAVAAPPLTSIQLGDPSSEKAGSVTAISAPVEKLADVALGEAGRRLIPANEKEPASISFDVKVDPEKQNYLTLRLWGSDATWTPVNLFTDKDSVNLGNLWWHVTREAPVPNRFLYRTFPIPIEVTRGHTNLRLRLETAPAPEKIGAFRNADAPKPALLYRPSFAIYGLHTHLEPWFTPRKRIGRAPRSSGVLRPRSPQATRRQPRNGCSSARGPTSSAPWITTSCRANTEPATAQTPAFWKPCR